MSTIMELHERAMSALDLALLAKRRGERVESQVHFESALEDERAAAQELKDELDAEPSRSILYRSAANIALLAGQTRESERLIATALAGNPPEDISNELRDLLDEVNFVRHLRVEDDTLHTIEELLPAPTLRRLKSRARMEDIPYALLMQRYIEEGMKRHAAGRD